MTANEDPQEPQVQVIVQPPDQQMPPQMLPDEADLPQIVVVQQPAPAAVEAAPIMPAPASPLPPPASPTPRRSPNVILYKDHTQDPDYSYFHVMVENQANKMLGGSCEPEKFAKPLMFIVRKWQRHRTIFKRDSREGFWKRNLDSMLERLKEHINPDAHDWI